MRRYLLDTHVWLWMLADPDRLARDTWSLIEDGSNELLLSAASSWEIAIKYRIGKLRLPVDPESYVPDRIRATGTTALPVEHTHALHVSRLPDHHKDPFDRLIVAQAQLLDLPIVTVDENIARYAVVTIPAA